MVSLPESVGHLQYRPLPNGIRELAFIDVSDAAIEECLVVLSQILPAAPLDKTLLLLSDLRESGLPTIYHVINLAAQLMTKYRRRPHIANAVVYTLWGAQTVFAGVMMRLAALYGAQVRFFYDHDEAAKWLLSEP